MAPKTPSRPTFVTPRTPPGVMELLPRQQLAFQRMLHTIEETYASYGFLPIETPVFERTEVLLGKNGGETEKQVFFVEKTGTVEKRLSDPDSGTRPDEALRFDLTVPLARYVAEHEHELVFPFRRYQSQRVYRGERPQRGRLNEFYQCDIDVIGKDVLAPHFDAELPAIICDVFDKLAFGDYTINFSNRKILTGLLQHHAVDSEAAGAALRELDKLDKIGTDKVSANLTGEGIGINTAVANQMLELAGLRGTNDEILSAVAKLPQTETLAQGYRELHIVCEGLAAQGVEHQAKLNLGIIRGLDYYTGTVYETTIDAHPEFGSICSGGRYENLAGHYTKSKLPGVGLSIGASRLFDQLRATDWAGALRGSSTEILVLMLDENLFPTYLRLATELRQQGLRAEVMLAGGKLDKQMKYADRSGIRYALLLGSAEQERGIVTLKDLADGSQRELPLESFATAIKGIVK